MPVDSVNSIVFVGDDGRSTQYDGPFEFLRDGGSFEISRDLDSRLIEAGAERLTEREEDLLLAWADGEVVGSGTIEASDVIEERLCIRVDDPKWMEPSEVEFDGTA